MLHKKQTFTFGDVVFTVDPKKPHIVMSLGKEKRSIKKNELWTMVFAISKKKKQADLIPVTSKEMMQFVRQVEFKATKDIKAGEVMKFHLPINIPMTVVQAALNERDEERVHEIADAAQHEGDIPSPFVDRNIDGV